jgi:hypothetical protein
MARPKQRRIPSRPQQPRRRATEDQSWLGRIQGSKREAEAILEADRRQREAAGRGPKSVILDPTRLEGRKWDAATILHTTLGGQLRPITPSDLAAFRRNIQLLRGRLGHGGITARQVIDLSGEYLPPGQGTDRDRAKREIHSAVPAGFSKGQLHVITNAGGTDPKVTRHHVLVKLPLFEVAVADVNMTADQAARWLLKQKLRYDCDCGRHRFFFRYVCTVGDFHAGRPEHGYPKIRNPGLNGVACKHVVRVMNDIDGGGSRFFNIIRKAIERQRDKDIKRKRVDVKQAEAEQQARASAKPIRTSADITSRRAQARARAAARAASRGGFSPPRKRGGILSKAKEIAVSVAQKLGLGGGIASRIIDAVRGKK